MRYYCNECKETITSAEYEYSRKHYGKPLCRACQRKTDERQKSKPTPRTAHKIKHEEDELDLMIAGAQKVWKGVKEVRKAVKESSIIRERDFNKWIDDWRKVRKLDFKFDQKHFFLAGDDLLDFTMRIIPDAAKTILLTNPYVELCALTDKLKEARDNGVEVKIVLRPETKDLKKVICQEELRKASINVKTDSRIHSKIIVIDDKVAVVSSMNFYPGSLAGQSHEAGIITLDEGVVNSATDYIKKFFE